MEYFDARRGGETVNRDERSENQGPGSALTQARPGHYRVGRRINGPTSGSAGVAP